MYVSATTSLAFVTRKQTLRFHDLLQIEDRKSFSDWKGNVIKKEVCGVTTQTVIWMDFADKPALAEVSEATRKDR